MLRHRSGQTDRLGPRAREAFGVGEKEIVQDPIGYPGPGKPGGAPVGGKGGATTGKPGGTDKPLGGDPPPNTGGDKTMVGGGKGPGSASGGGPGGDSAGGGDDCFDLEMKRRDLVAKFNDAAKINRAAADEAVDAFYNKYKDAAQAAKITDAVVSSNNKVGEALIDVAIKAAKTFGGEKTQVSEAADKAQELKDKYLPMLKDWMHDGATKGDLDRAKSGYIDFAGSATRANIAANIAKKARADIEALDKEAQAKGCPSFGPVPNAQLKTFDIGEFGKGAEKKTDGPTISQGEIGGSSFTDDLFGAGQKQNVTFYH